MKFLYKSQAFKLTSSTRIKFNSFSAFTLAEVLITLGIIGVVAAITIPTLISNSQKNQVAKKVEKTYSTLCNAFKMEEVDQGPSETWASSTASSASAYKDWWDEYSVVSYLSVVKQCTGTTGDCWTTNANWLDGTTFTIFSNLPSAVLNNGVSIALSSVSPTGNRAYIWFDINGPKPPNIVGKDIFIMSYVFRTGKCVTFGSGGMSVSGLLSENQDYMCSKSSGTGKGQACIEVIQDSGWEIPDDYPWN